MLAAAASSFTVVDRKFIGDAKKRLSSSGKTSIQTTFLSRKEIYGRFLDREGERRSNARIMAPADTNSYTSFGL